MSTEHRRPGSSRRKKVYWILGIVFILLLIGGIFAAKPIKNAFDDRKAETEVEKAMELYRRGKTKLAFEQALKAREIAPENPDVMRLLGTMLKDNPQSRDNASYFFRKLHTDGHATSEDRVALAEIHLAEGQIVEARKIVDEVAAADPQNPRLLSLLATMERSGSGGLEGIDAVEMIRGADAGSEDTAAEKMALARAKLAGATSDLRKEGVEMLWDLTGDQSLTGLEAMVILSRFGSMGNREMEKLIKGLDEHPFSEEKHKLLATSIRIKRQPEMREKIIADEVKARLGLPISDLDDFLLWLLSENESGWILDLIPVETAKKRMETLGVIIEALSREEKWAELQELILDPELKIATPQRMLIQARCLKNTGASSAQLRKHLSDTINAGKASKNFGVVAGALTMAEELDYDDITRTGLSILVTNEEWRERALIGQYRLARNHGDTREILARAKAVLQHLPDNDYFKMQVSYLELLRGENIEIAYQKALAIANENSSDPQRQMLRALAQFRMGDYQGALATVSALEPANLRPGARAIYALILRSNGKAHRAVQIAQEIPLPLLMPEEKGFVLAVLNS